MKARSKLHYRSRCLRAAQITRLWATGAVAGFIAVSAARGAAPKPAPPPPVVPQITHELQFVKSTFVATPGPGFGTDPFFPKTARFQHTSKTVETPGPVSFLSLKGISRAGNRRTAIINNRTFEVGEEGEVKINAQPFRVRCIEIRDDGVTVSVNGQPQKLTLTPK